MQALACAVRRAAVTPAFARAGFAGARASAAAVRFNSNNAGEDADLAARQTNPKNMAPEYLLKFKHYHTVKELVHKTSYFLAAGVPLTILLSGGSLDAVSHVIDWGMTFAIPAHFHVGMRAVLLDYAHFWFNPSGQSIAYKILAAITVLTFLGLVKFNLKDVGITKAVTMLFNEQVPKKKAEKAAAAPKAAAAQLK